MKKICIIIISISIVLLLLVGTAGYKIYLNTYPVSKETNTSSVLNGTYKSNDSNFTLAIGEDNHTYYFTESSSSIEGKYNKTDESIIYFISGPLKNNFARKDGKNLIIYNIDNSKITKEYSLEKTSDVIYTND